MKSTKRKKANKTGILIKEVRIVEEKGKKEKGDKKMLKKCLTSMLILILVISLSGCLATTSTGRRGEILGTGIGALGGAALDSTNPWRGAFIGGTLGNILGGAVGDTEAQNQPPPQGYWITIPGHYENGRWIEEHREWIPYQ